MAGQGDRAAEGAVAALDSVGLLLGRIARGVPLALDCQQAVLEGDLHVVGLDAREFGRYQVGVLAFADVDRWCPGLGAGTTLVPLAGPAARRPRKNTARVNTICFRATLFTI